MEAFLNSTGKLTTVGGGFCGTVWAAASGIIVIKRADGGPGRSLPNEHYIHRRVLNAIREQRRSCDARNTTDKQDSIEAYGRTKVNIPYNHAFLEQASSLWPAILPRLPDGFAACEALLSERIPPMNLAVRELLSSHYCPSKHQATLLARDKSSESCLVRPYLGRRRLDLSCGGGGPKQRFFSLRNFPLHVDQMEELKLPVEAYATAMADALAFLHWVVKIDANDMEFVLAPARACAQDDDAQDDATPSIGDEHLFSDAFGVHSMWILDFDCCRVLEMNEKGMRQAAMSFWRNDPFYPRPGAKNEEDQRLWRVFEQRFLDASSFLLSGESDEIKTLPDVLIRMIRDNRHTWAKGAIY
ncbi:hypothetical protein MY10362_006908 [Beauveria mimosiformis]